MGKNIIIIGSGGHAKVIIDILQKSGDKILGLIDDDPAKSGAKVLGVTVLGDQSVLSTLNKDFEIIIGIGDNKTRKSVAQGFKESEYSFGTAIHPTAVIGTDVKIGKGTVVMANTVLNSGTVVGEHCIINTSVSIDHDNIIDDFVHFSPGSTTGGAVKIGTLTWIGLGANIINNISIGKNSIVGSGSVVIEDLGDNILAVGIPAKIKKEL